LSNEGVEGFKESGSAGKGNGPDGAKKADTVPSAPRPTLKPQPWQDTARIIFGDAVMRFWIEPLWLEGTAMHCPTRFIRNTVEEKYSKVLCRVTGLALTFVFAPPPPHAFVDCPPQPPTGEDHGQNEATA
jgi:hypothetical protein